MPARQCPICTMIFVAQWDFTIWLATKLRHNSLNQSEPSFDKNRIRMIINISLISMFKLEFTIIIFLSRNRRKRAHNPCWANARKNEKTIDCYFCCCFVLLCFQFGWRSCSWCRTRKTNLVELSSKVFALAALRNARIVSEWQSFLI